MGNSGHSRCRVIPSVGESPPAPSNRIRILDRWPDGILYEAWGPGEEPVDMAVLLKGRPVSTQTLFANKRTVLLGLPGAFTPNCHMYHVPPYVERAQEFLDAGVDQIVAFTVNDVFCTRAWIDAIHASPRVRVLSDPDASVTKSIGLKLDATATVGRAVCRRFCALLEDGVVKLLFVEHGDGLGVVCSAATPLLSEVQSKRYEQVLGPGALWVRPDAGASEAVRSSRTGGHSEADDVSFVVTASVSNAVRMGATRRASHGTPSLCEAAQDAATAANAAADP